MGLLGYQKGERLVFNDKRCCGLWFIIIGAVILVAAAFGGEQKINTAIFVVGFMGGFYLSVINKVVVSKLSTGPSSPFQNKVATLAVVFLFPLMFLLSGPFFPCQNWRMIWLGTFLAVGLHFFPFYFVHGKSMLLIGLLCSVNAVGGMLLSGTPFLAFAIIDALIKIGFGTYLLFFSKPTTNKE